MGKIQLKYGSQSAVPSGLLDGEFAINLDTHQLWYGSGSAVLSDIRFDKITAEQYVISSSVTHMTTSFSSGSTEFGDSSDDTHTFTGDIIASGTISASGAIYGTVFTTSPGGRVQSATDSGLLLQADTDITYTADSDGDEVGQHIFKDRTATLLTLDETGADFSSNITASGNISSSGYISATGTGYFGSHITASGNISSSGTIYTDNLSSPGNDLTIASTTVTITAGTAGDANLILQADTDNNDEADNPFMLFEQDGGAIRSIIGHTGADSEWPDATPLTGGKSNNLVIGTTGSAGASRGMQFAVLNTVAMTVSSSGNVGIGTTSPTELLTVNGNISASGYLTAGRLYLDASSGAYLSYQGGTTISTNGALHVGQSISAVGTILAGWHGSTTRVKILPSDFIPDDVGRPAQIDDTGSDRWLESHSTAKLFASIPIPAGFKATHVHIYGSATSAITVYEADINSKTVTSRGTGNIGTEIDITDVTSDTTNYLFLELAQASGEEVYGGYVTIATV